MNDPLLQPFRIGDLVIRNRLMTTAHEPAYSEDGMPKARYRRYHVERARGGIGLTMTAGSAVVSADSPPAFGNLLAYRDEIVPWLRALSDECHEHGAAVMIQITHLGRRTGWNKGDWLPVVAPSAVREPAHRAFPKPMEDWDIERIVADYAAAAARMAAAGLDGVEIEAYGHLPDQFWSPATNTRNDVYGGALENRMRFSVAVLEAVRKAVPAGFLVGIRMVGDEGEPGGLSPQDGIAIARRLHGNGLVDFINVIRGHIATDMALTRVIPVMGMQSAPGLDFAGEIRAATGAPVFHAARIQDVATARHAIASGKLDMVGMTRAHIADPHIAAKLASGREDRIRPCVGATYCLDRIYEGGEALCIHNAATGREATMPHVVPAADVSRRVVIVGAGPAGLEAARVCAERGHDVRLFEAQNRAGGQAALAARQPRRRELQGIVDWRLDELARHGVAIAYDTYADRDLVLAQAPDVVIVATGGVPQSPPLRTGDDLVTSTWDVIAAMPDTPRRVLVYDDHGGYAAMQAAEMLAVAGNSVEIVTPERFFAPEMGGLNHARFAAAFAEHGVGITINTRLLAVERAANGLLATLGSDYAGRTTSVTFDQIVVEHGVAPLTDLYEELKPLSSNLGAVDLPALLDGRPQALVRNAAGRFRLFRIGDAVASRNIHAAIYDALRLAKDL